jgi:glycosyltransferase involved in cell wall biosynthesis
MNLTIAIPTYDRPKELLRCVAALAPQLTPDVELLVVDNASDVPATEVLQEVLAAHPAAKITIRRNAYNIGGNANILRCLEYTDTEWVWIVGDDDVPHPGSLAKARQFIEDNPEAICINFKSAFGPKAQSLETKGRLDFLTRCPGFGNVIFISANLYRAGAMRPNLYIGHRYAYSMAPHFAMLLSSMGEGDRVLFVDDELAVAEVCDGANHWSSISQALSWPTLMELNLEPNERKLLADRLQVPSVASVLIQLLGTGLKRGEYRTSAYYYGQIEARMRPFAPLGRRIFMSAGKLAFVFPKPSIKLIDIALSRARGASIAKRMRRDLDDPHG